MVLDPAVVPEGTQGDDHLVEALSPVGEVLSGCGEFLLAPTDSDSETQPVRGQDGGGSDRLGDRDEVPRRRDVDAGREQEVPGDRRESRDEAHRVRPFGVLLPERRSVFGSGVGVAALQLAGVEDVVRDHQARIAEIVARDREVDDLVDGQECDAPGGTSRQRPGARARSRRGCA